MIPLHKVLVAANATDEITRTLYSGMLTEGPRVKAFEAALAEYLGTQVLATNSCTSAIDLALHLCGVGPGDHVVATPYTCAASNTHVVLRGAKLIWCDIDRHTGQADPQSIAELVDQKTKAIIIVDWGGRFLDCSLIRTALAWQHKPAIPIIQDAAHSFGALFRGRPAHSQPESGTYVAWSFQAIKHLTTGDGGALKVPPDQYTRARALRWFGIDRETKAKFRFLQDIKEAGYKYHMNDLTAALGLANLKSAKAAVESHRRNAHYLGVALSECRKVKLPPWDDESSWWFYSLLTPRWEEFVQFSESKGVGAGPVHGRNDAYTAHGKSDRLLPGVDHYAGRHVAIPCGWWLSQADLDHIANVVLEWDSKL